MQDIFLIGGSPSSGSTLLVKLLNQNGNVICLPETGLFAHGCNLFNHSEDYVEDGLGWHLPWLLTGVKVADALGWREDEYEELIQHYPTAFELLRSRIDPDRKYWLIEKAPENIFAFEKYLADSKSNRVIVTSRDALSVVQSLMRRGFTLLEGMLTWFAHSYETARLISNYPSQVYHCAYDQLAKSPGRITAEIVQFLGIKDKPPGNANLTGNNRFSDSALHKSADKQGSTVNQDSIEMFLEISSWGLTDTSWSNSPDAAVRYFEPVNLIGLDFELMMDRVAFNTPSHDFIRPIDVEASLCGISNKLVAEVGLHGEEIKAHFNSSYTRSLAEHYSPCFLRI